MQDKMTIKDASVWASDLLGKKITPSNISYLVQYGRIPKIREDGPPLVTRKDLIEYYNTYHEVKKKEWKKQLGNDLNWHLSFAEYKESETTKHVHRLHPYKGKFIPQLVEYFLDQWFLQVVRDEIDFVFNQVKSIKNTATKNILTLVLSRTIRSCRATTHADLGTLKEPIISAYCRFIPYENCK